METKIENKSEKTVPIINESNVTEPILISGILPDNKLEKEEDLAGVLCQGVQYYDFRNIPFISNTGLASLIRILKASLKQGIKLKFVNVNKRIQQKIQTMGLDKFINCS